MMRSISDYSDNPPIIPNSAPSLLFLKDETLDSVKEYYEWGQEAHSQKIFGKKHDRVKIAKNQIGILQRINFLNSKTLSLLFKEPSMGGGVIMFGFFSKDQEITDLLFGYLSSSLFLLDALHKSRARSAEFVRIHKIDFFRIYRLPNLVLIKKQSDIKKEILSRSELYNSGTPLDKRPRFAEKIQEARTNPDDPLRKLDESWFKALNIDISLIDQFYQEIEDKLSELTEKRTQNT